MIWDLKEAGFCQYGQIGEIYQGRMCSAVMETSQDRTELAICCGILHSYTIYLTASLPDRYRQKGERNGVSDTGRGVA